MLKKIYTLFRLFLFIFKEEFLSKIGIRRKVQVIQLSITNRCNSRCLTCNVWKQNQSKRSDISAAKLAEILNSDYFKGVTHVGLNGGELTLDKTTLDVVDAVLSLPSIRSLNIISNGLYTNKLLEYTIIIHEKCKSKGVFLGLTLSFDGIRDIQIKVRGVSGAWDKTFETFNKILENKSRYCDRLGIGCTISKHNVAYLIQFDDFFSEYNVPIEYHLAVPNRRIGTFFDADYSVLTDERSRMLTAEFFFRKMNMPNIPLLNVLRYYLQFNYLQNKGHGRLALCSFLDRDVTIDEHLKMYLCATASKEIGDLNGDSVEDIMKSNKYKEAYKELCSECSSCIHYSYYPTIRGLFSFIHYKVKNKHSFLINKFKILLKW